MALPFPILFEDDFTLAIAKPEGLASVPRSPQDPTRDNAEALVREVYPDARAVHRLDTDTSGVLLFAKSAPETERLRALWNTESLHKTYRALAVLPESTTLPPTINCPIGHAARSAKRMVAVTQDMAGHRLSTSIRGTPRPALTHVESVEPLGPWTSGGTLVDVRLRILTGVRHQIRVHLKACGASLLGDPLYSKVIAARLCLHAWQLEWPGADGHIRRVEAPLPEIWFQPLL